MAIHEMKTDSTVQTTTAASFKERQRQARETAILDAAAQILAAHGWRALSIEEIASRVGIATGTIYLHFAGKDALVAALIARELETAVAFVAGVDPALPALTRLRLVLRMLLQRQASGMRLVTDELRELRRLATADAHCAERLCALRRLLESLVDEGKDRGELDPALPSPVAVGALFALISPRTAQQLESATGEPISGAHDALIRFYLRGVARDVAAIDEQEG